jgi:hypothetical protein
MHQQLWGYTVEEKLYVGVREQKRLNTAVLEHFVAVRHYLNPLHRPESHCEIRCDTPLYLSRLKTFQMKVADLVRYGVSVLRHEQIRVQPAQRQVTVPFRQTLFIYHTLLKPIIRYDKRQIPRNS